MNFEYSLYWRIRLGIYESQNSKNEPQKFSWQSRLCPSYDRRRFLRVHLAKYKLYKSPNLVSPNRIWLLIQLSQILHRELKRSLRSELIATRNELCHAKASLIFTSSFQEIDYAQFDRTPPF